MSWRSLFLMVTLAVCCCGAAGASTVEDRNLLWQKQIEKDPKNAQTHLGYGKFLVNAGLVNKAIAELSEAARLDPKDPDAFITLAEIYSQDLDYDKAFLAARRALALQPSSSAARTVLVGALVQRDQVTEAESELEKLLQTNPKDPRVLQLAYLVKTRIGDFNEAARYLQQAVALRPNNTEWVLQLCQLLESGGNSEAAYIQLQNLLARNPGNVEARLRLARNIEVYRHDYEQALVEYARVLDIDSKSPAALAGIERCKAKKNNLALRMKQALRGLFGVSSPRIRSD